MLQARLKELERGRAAATTPKSVDLEDEILGALGRRLDAEEKGEADKFGDDFNYMSFTVWEDRDAFMGWRNSQSFKDAHSSGPKKEEGAPKQPPPWVKPPSVVFWEGVLELTGADGA